MSVSLATLFTRHVVPSVWRRADRMAAMEPSGSIANPVRAPTVWFEVEDFLRYFDHFRSPTGLQRVPFETYSEAERLYGRSGRVRFCRLSAYSGQLRAITFDTVLSAYSNPPGANAPWRTIWEPEQFWSNPHRMLPLMVRHPRFFLSMFKTVALDLLDKLLRRDRFKQRVHKGDIVVSLGAAWGLPNYMRRMADVKRRYGIKFAMMIHDLIPIEYQALVDRRHTIQFRNWLAEAVPVADMVLTTSKYSQNALLKLAKETGWPLPPVQVVPPGAGLNERPTKLSSPIDLPERYVLFVSTIEIRKNHRLLVRVWQRLMERHGADAIPTLVFAGQIGWLVDDLLAELKASDHLGGKIVIFPGLPDAELRQTYRASMFTVFPSLCEGWGLPVAESLMHGRFCVASNRTSIPEVGGDLIDYFDPSNEDDALEKIERLLLDPAYLAAREARLRLEYRPRSWADCVHAMIGELAIPAAAYTGTSG